jgi:lysyl-tRNA synthetase, class II
MRWMHSPQKRSERLLGKLVTLGNPFCQIESLYRFNAKFFPRWEPRYLVYEGALGLPRAGIAAFWAEGQLWKPTLRRPADATGRHFRAPGATLDGLADPPSAA